MQKRILIRILMLMMFAGLSLGIYAGAEAAVTGKITGRVLDNKGGALPGANVTLEDTNRGATADQDGYYLILSVDPGVYNLKVSMIGYSSKTVTGATVASDITTTLDFELLETALEAGEITVVAERPVVELDVTASRYVVSAEDILVVPILRSANSFIEMEAGVNVDGTNRIRNAFGTTGSTDSGSSYGFSEAAEYAVDGILVNMRDGRSEGGRNPGGGTSISSNWTGGVNVSAVREITVLAGGLNAEYGNIGSIRIVTREGGRRFHGSGHYRASPAQQQHWGRNVYDANNATHRGRLRFNDSDWAGETDATGRRVHQVPSNLYDGVTGHFLEGSLSGAILDQASFFVSTRSDFQPKTFPEPERRTPFNTNTSYKLTVNAAPNLKLRAGGLYSWNKGRYAGAYDPRAIFLPQETGRGGFWKTSDNVVYASATHTVSPRMFYEVRLSRYISKQENEDIPSETTNPTLDADGWFYVDPGTVRDFNEGEQNRFSLQGDFSVQATRTHFVKAGINLTRYDVHKLDAKEDVGGLRRQLFFIGHKGQIGDGITPLELTGYLQDKMEFEGLIVNAGLRYERFWNQEVPLFNYAGTSMGNTYSRWLQSAKFAKMEPMQWFLPRLGISHPITSRSKIHFFYGKYHTRPDFNAMFLRTWRALGNPSLDMNSNGQIDPAEVNNNLDRMDQSGNMFAGGEVGSIKEAQISTAFELGAEWNFIGDYSVQSTAYYRISSGFITSGSQHFFDPVRGNRDLSSKARPKTIAAHASTRGIELSLKKRMRSNFSFKAAMNVGWGDMVGRGGNPSGGGRTQTIPDINFFSDPDRYWSEWTVDPQTGAETPKTLSPDKFPALAVRTQAWIDDALAGTRVNSTDQKMIKLWEQKGLSSEARQGLKGLWGLKYHIFTETDRQDAVNAQGSLVFVYASPPDAGPGGMFWGAKPLGDLRINLIYRIYTGERLQHSDPVTNRIQLKEGPANAITDLSVQKGFNIRGVRSLVYLEMNNLFNRREMPGGSDYVLYGLVKPRPTDANYQQFGDVEENTRFGNDARQLFAGLRVTW